MPFSALGLHPDLVRGVKAMGFTVPTPIQQQAMPLALEGSDVLGCASTGSGKTAAFGLPILNHILKNPKPGLRALILVPTRELAAQVETTFRDVGRFTDIKVAMVIGGVGFHGQNKSISDGAQILVATPGRLLDHLQRGNFKLSQVELLVLDEADRMLDMGFLPDIRAIISRVPKDRQTMLFSATLLPEIERVAAFAMRNPKRVEISKPQSIAEGISQIVYPISQMQKGEFLVTLLKATEMRSVLIFCRTKHGADRLARRLQNTGFTLGILHADRTQGQRTEAMDRFREGKTQILVATDIAARGIDVKDISHVINYDVPQHPEDYVHRVGRTARAYSVGDAITLMDPLEQQYLGAIERFVGIVFPRAILPDFKYTIQPVLQAPKPKSFKDMRFRTRAAPSRRALFRR